MRYRTPLATVFIVFALVAAACSSGSSDGASPTTVPAVSTTAAQDDSGATDTTVTTTEATTTTVSEPVFVGADPITQTTPTSGGGLRPLLEWDAVDGAALYFVTIYTETGGSYWSAVTAETNTYVGGPLQIPEGRTGPIVVEGYTWTVVAEDTDGNMVAASPSRSIAP